MSPVPCVSVVMPVFNCANFLEEAVHSILRQSFSDFEFIIINDGSTDGSAAMLTRFAQADARIRLFHQENQGLIVTLNRGIQLARGKYIARMDADDVALTDRFQKQITFLECHPNVAILGGAMEVMDAQGAPLHRISYPCRNEEIQAGLLQKNCFAHPTVMMRKEAVQAVGGYRQAFLHAEDYDLWLRVADKYELANLPDSLHRYRIHSSQVTALHVQQQIVSTLAARTAAQIRRQRGTDPASEFKLMTAEVLYSFGVSEEFLAVTMVDACLASAALLLKTGGEKQARELVGQAMVFDQRGKIPKRTAALIYLALAGLSWRQKQWGHSLRWLGRACAIRPSLAVKLHRPKIRRWFSTQKNRADA